MKVWLCLLTAIQIAILVLLCIVLADYRVGVHWDLFQEALRVDAVESIFLAAQLGRLDIVSLILALFGILLAFAFIGWMSFLRAEAKAAVREIAEKEASDRLDKFISDEAAGIIQGYLDLLYGMSGADADRLARETGGKGNDNGA